MINAGFLALLLVVSLAAEECDLSSFVISYNVTVDNVSERPVHVTILLDDATRSSLVAAGTSATLTSYAGGNFQVLATDYDIARAREIVHEFKELNDRLKNPTLPPEDIKAIKDRMHAILAEAKSTEVSGATGTCRGMLKAPNRQSVVVKLSNPRGNQWVASGC